MELVFTPPILSHDEIRVDDTDIFDDAWGFKSEFGDVLSFLGELDYAPADSMSEKLINLAGEKYRQK